jgi:DNA-binding LytR/AlgR family response regulator
MKIRTLIVDDEANARERLREILAAIPTIELIGEAADGHQAVEMIRSLRPDLVFLDVRMPGASGFEVLEQIDMPPLVVFVTAYDEYAIQAFEENAIDYILKPFSTDRILTAVTRVMDRSTEIGSTLIDRLKRAVTGEEYLRIFAVRLKDEMILIPEQDVFYFSAKDKYVFLHTRNQEFFYDSTLKNLEKRLDPQRFQRVHRSYIVALDKIRKLRRWFRGEHVLHLTDEGSTTLSISRNYHGVLLEKLGIR